MRDITAWLKNLGLGKYQALFAENEIDFEVLPELTDQDLKDLDFPLALCRLIGQTPKNIFPLTNLQRY